MDKLRHLSRGAQIVLGGAVLFLVFSFLNWFEIKRTDLGESMWHGIGVVAGLLVIALIVWQALRLANINVELGVTPSMITAALAVLLLLFTFIRFIDKPGGGLADSIIERTVWAWLGLILAIAIVVGAWLDMQAAGESLADVRSRLQSMTSSRPAERSTAPPPPPSAETPPPSTSQEGEGEPPPGGQQAST
ncbi:MAG TPA: hypothetical protein VFB26_05790 [Gaiellaceae bacterium]|nr:hypothetical protein [Gaiellaceae bacterium]